MNYSAYFSGINKSKKHMAEHKLNEGISVDCVIFGFDSEKLHVLLVDRVLADGEGTQIVSDRTLTGNHIYEDESLDEAARRILFDLTGLNQIYLEQFHTFGAPNRISRPNDITWVKANGRDPNKRVVSVGYAALLTKRDVVLEWRGRNVSWYPVDSITDLAFDHVTILQTALNYIRHKISLEPAIGFELLPRKFTLSQLQTMFEVVFGTTLDKRNFRRKVLKTSYIVPLDEKLTGLTNKPAQLYTFNRRIYDKTRTLENAAISLR